jgi:hypothetical protein
MIWARVKGEVTQLYNSPMLTDSWTKQLENWISRVQYAKQLQEFHKEVAQDIVMQCISINLGSDDQ